jgi:4-amino-4-deoxy-L-arabinose transferase-like glycosyltransferase
MRDKIPGTARKFPVVAQYALVVFVTGVLMLWRLGMPALDGHEAYVAATGRSMANADAWLNPDIAEGPIPANTLLNHWLIPVFNGEPRVVKTPLAYWCVAALMKLGLPANEFSARLPSALASVALAVVVLALGRSMFSPPAAMIGALMLATSLAFVSWGRDARADMQMTLWMAAAMACVYWAMRQSASSRGHLLLLLAWGCLGLANLAKQLAPLFVLLPIALYLCWRTSCAGDDGDRPRRLLVRYLIRAGIGFAVFVLVRIIPALHWWRWSGLTEGAGIAITVAATIGGPAIAYAFRSRAWRQLSAVLPTALPGLLLMLAMFVPWMAYMADTFPQAYQVLTHQTTDRALGTGGWAERSVVSLTGYYVWALAKWSLPWVAFLPGALAIVLMNRFREDRDALAFLLLWVFGLVLLFNVSVGKHEYYILPAVPAVCLLMGYCAEDVFFKHRWISLSTAKAIVVGHALGVSLAAVGAIIALATIPHDLRPKVMRILLIADLALLPVWAAVLALSRARPYCAVAMLVLAVVLGELAFMWRPVLWSQKRESYAQLGQAIGRDVAPAADLTAWVKSDPAIVWYAGRDLPPAEKQKARLVRVHGKEPGEDRWRHWLLAGDRPLYVLGTTADASELSKLGFEAATAVEDGDRGELRLYRRQMSFHSGSAR